MPDISAFPTKRFFVEMLVRDIELQDAILDLLDNCVDGAMRSIEHDQARIASDTPYAGFWAKINFSAGEFSIEDNCGGIPRNIAIKSAFRLGRPEPGEEDAEDLPTVGVYGIGMKRAIFKIGRNAIVSSRHEQEAFDVSISPEWMENDVWNLQLLDRDPHPNEIDGTHIIINDIRPGVAQEFGLEAFFDSFCAVVSQYYSIIIQRGFKVIVGDIEISPKHIGFILDTQRLDQQGLAPYVYRKDPALDGVEVQLAVGFYRPLLSEEESEQQETQEKEGRPTSELAGWTVIINDRVVLYADKSRATGWDEAGVPGYHTQFTSIAGVVVFRSKTPELLPLTTTKRGVNGNSDLYLAVKNHMRVGLKLFTSFTNQWKKTPEQREELHDDAQRVSAEDVFKILAPRLRASRKEPGAFVYVPSLPQPKPESRDRWIRFKRPLSEVQVVGRYLFDDADTAPSTVGEICFVRVLKEAGGEDQ